MSDLTNGWVQQPNGRGTWNILQTCVITVVLCSWSSLCLNVHPRKGRWPLMRNKLRWMLFTIMWPEVTAGCAFEQWESACQSVDAFAKSGYPQWTMRHAFLADMGGFVLHSPDFPPFPVDGQQLLYLIQKKYVEYPQQVDSEYIWDKNKADVVARAITLVQVAWFSIECVGRAIQRLNISTLELLTITFIFCTMPSVILWNHKPLDIQTPIPIQTDTRIADILIEAGEVAKSPYELTPLDFLVPPPNKANFVATWWWGVELCFDGIFFEINEKVRPVTTFANSRTRPPKGFTTKTFITRLAISCGYFALHFAGWNFQLPTSAERELWRAAITFFAGIYSTYLVVFNLVSYFSHHIAKTFGNKDADTCIEVANLFPRWFILMGLIPVYGSYGIARLYIITEGFISLRSMPEDVYSSVNWSNFIPHF